jgi:hypothetical protein
MKKVYLNPQRPTKYDGAHFIVYLNARPAEYREDENSEPVQGVEYTGTMEDGGTLIDCDEWNRDKLINGIIRTKYLQTEEDAIKTHQLQLLQVEVGLDVGSLSAEKRAEYLNEWAEFQEFRQAAIDIVNTWDNWE